MFPRPQDQPRRSRLSLRIAVLGGVAVALFAVLFFRLWNLQVLDGSKYLAEAQNNRTREYRVIAPRGEILDREGEVLVDNRTSQALVIAPSKLPSDPAEEKAELEKLGSLVHMDLKRVREAIVKGEEVAAGAPVTLRRDIGYPVVYYVEEHQRQFPGVSIQRVFVRAYPDGTRAAQVLGYASEITEEELEEPQNKKLQPGDYVGQSGVEAAYDKVLQGKPGVTKIQVDAMGQPTPGGQLVSEPPEPGDNMVLTLNSKVQAAGEQALAEFGLPGAFVSMNIHTGEILGMGSNPTFEPKVFTETMTQKKYDELFNDPILAPLTNRATESAYPTGSTYKIITALAALENGVVTPETVIQDNGCIELAGEKFCNAEGAVNGPISLVHALQVSSDVYFYELGRRMWDRDYLQEWSHKLGIGRPTGLDIGNESPGLVPSKQWRDHLYKLYEEGKEGGTERPWSAGDNVQLATGQGDLQTNPLQMAVAYATLGTDGEVPTPHVGLEVQDPAGRVLREFDFGVRRHVHIDPTWRKDILEGLHEAAQVPGGTAAPVFESFPIPIAGKTGTAERPPHPNDQSWFIALSPYPDPDIVTVVTIEEGGFGAHAAAPAAREILEALYSKKLEEAAEGSTEGIEETTG